MKNVLIVATTSYAGMGPYTSEIVNSFHVEDNVFFFFVDDVDKYYLKNIKEELRLNSTFYSYKNSAWHKLLNLITYRTPYNKNILKLCRDKQIKVVHYINDVCPIQMKKRLESMGINVWSTVHDLHPHEVRKAWYKVLRHKLGTHKQNQNFNKCQNIITNSLVQYDEIRKMFPNKTVVYHSFPSLVTSIVANGQMKTAEIANIQKPYILFFGRIEEYKGIALLYEAFSRMQNTNHILVIAGSGELPQQVKPISNRIIIINRYIADEEIRNLYKGAACVVYPYYSATQSGVLSLAFYFETPVICSDIPFFKTIIEKSKGGILFENGNVEDLKDKLTTFVAQGNHDKMCTCGRKYYDKNYDASAIRTALLTIYGGGNFKLKNNKNGIIKTREEMNECIQVDFESYKMKHPLAAHFTYGENWELFAYMKNLRHLEYYTNKRQRPWDKLLKAYYWLQHRKKCKRMCIDISPNSVGPGFHLQHRGFRLIQGNTQIGNNCEVLPMVLMGKKHPDSTDYHISIGHNCYISTGVTILGPVTIGDNVTIAAGAVVVTDIPDNAVVGGVPAKIIKMKSKP